MIQEQSGIVAIRFVLSTFEAFKKYVEKLLGLQGTLDPNEKDDESTRTIYFNSPTGVRMFHIYAIEENKYEDDLPTWWVVSYSSSKEIETFLRREINDMTPDYYGK